MEEAEPEVFSMVIDCLYSARLYHRAYPHNGPATKPTSDQVKVGLIYCKLFAMGEMLQSEAVCNTSLDLYAGWLSYGTFTAADDHIVYICRGASPKSQFRMFLSTHIAAHTILQFQNMKRNLRGRDCPASALDSEPSFAREVMMEILWHLNHNRNIALKAICVNVPEEQPVCEFHTHSAGSIVHYPCGHNT